MVGDGASTHKIDYVKILQEILNLEGHLNRITGFRVTAILLNVWIFPIGGATAVEGLLSKEPTPSSSHSYTVHNYQQTQAKPRAALQTTLSLTCYLTHHTKQGRPH